MRRLLSAVLAPAAVAASLNTAPAEDFQEVSSRHFRVLHESAYAPAGVLNTLESLRAKLLLDLALFAPWAREGTIRVTLYRTPEEYRRRTGAPPWAAAHVDVKERRVFVYESGDFARTMAHEMAHLLFEDFFVSKGARPPAWLNEGVATLMEWDYGLEGEEAAGRRALAEEEMPPLAEFLEGPAPSAEPGGPAASLWYRQASGVVRLLMRDLPQTQFFSFCGRLRDGEPLDAALKGAYGLQVPDVAALERLWRESLREE